MTDKPHLDAIYPELEAGGFSRVDGTIGFYTRVQALLAGLDDSIVVNLGAGRGKQVEDKVAYRRDLRDLRRPGRVVVGVDIDEAVLENPSLDQAHVIEPSARVPFDDGSVDVVVSDFTFEHIDDPAWAGRELTRVTRPGGWLCARTPNKWGYIGIGGRAVPNGAHVSALRRLQPTKEERDSFPTAYLLNTPRDLRRTFPDTDWRRVIWSANGEPNYAGRSKIAARMFRSALALTPPPFQAMLYVFFQRQ